MHGGRWSRDALIAAASFVIMMGLLFAGESVFRLASVNRPVAVALRGAPDVLTYRLSEAGGTSQLTVTLRPGADLARVDRIVRGRLQAAGAAGVQLRFRAAVSAGALQSQWEQLGATVAQGMATGGFVSMVASVERAAAKSGDEARIVVGTRWIYVTLVRGQAALYEVLARGAGGSS